MKKLKDIYNSKYFPRFFSVRPDGGKDSGVTAYFLIEWKILFSIGILHFKKGSRDAYHSHAFDALTWWLKGKVTELILNCVFDGYDRLIEKYEDYEEEFKPSLIPKFTSRYNMHKIVAHENTWALTFRGPWNDSWFEFKDDRLIKLTHGRKKI